MFACVEGTLKSWQPIESDIASTLIIMPWPAAPDKKYQCPFGVNLEL